MQLVSRPEDNHWVLHGRGGLDLIKLRGPSNHTTEFDWMLLKSQGLFLVSIQTSHPVLEHRQLTPVQVLDDMFNLRSSIFEAPEWQRVFKQASQAATDPDAGLWWEMFGLMCFVPGMVSELKTLFLKPYPQSDHFNQTSNLLERARWLYDRMHDSHINYQKSTSSLSLLSLPVGSESLDRIRLRLFYLTCLIQICRAIATVSEDETERATREEEAQTLAAQALLIQWKTADLDPAMSFHLQQGRVLFASTVRTKAAWDSGTQPSLACELPGYLARRWMEWQTLVDGFIIESLNA